MIAFPFRKRFVRKHLKATREGDLEGNGPIRRSLNGLVACKVDAFDQGDRKMKFKGSVG